MANRYVYHYHALYEVSPGCIAHIDGIAQLENRIRCQEEYMKLKPQIDSEHSDKLTIASLSFIGMEQD
ncbi:MAG: hypothetical protein Alis3KO_00690 [Aliiglaciecola sp.]